jgi:hypothetical protein
MGLQLHIFFISALAEEELSDTGPGNFTPREEKREREREREGG